MARRTPWITPPWVCARCGKSWGPGNPSCYCDAEDYPEYGQRTIVGVNGPVSVDDATYQAFVHLVAQILDRSRQDTVPTHERGE